MGEHRAGRALRAAGVVAAMGAAAALAGCGGGSASSSSTSAAGGSSTTPSASASTTTAAASGKAAAAGLRELAQRSAAATRSASTARMTMSSGAAPASVKPVANAMIRFGATTTDMALDLLGSTGTTKAVVLDGKVYFSTGRPIGGKHWIKIDPAGKDRVSRAVAPLLSSMTGNFDPTAQLAHMPDARLTSVTPATVDGTPVTKYVVTMTERDLLSVAEAFHMPAQVKQQTEAALKGAHATSTLYLDANDLPLRAESVVSGTARSNTATVVTYSGWGKPVAITAPPATDLVDPKALAG